jgi:iron complex outermembrane receptor protein
MRLFLFFCILLILDISYIFAREIELDPIIITSGPFKHEGEAPTKDIVIINPVQEPGLSIEELLDREAALDVSRRGILGIQSDLSIRGATDEQTTIAINGIILNDPQTAHHNLDLAMPKFAIKRIEIAEGPSADVWAQGAVGGAVNVITVKPVSTGCKASFMYGTDSTQKGSVYLAQSLSNGGINFAVEEVTSNGWRFDTDFREFSVSSSALVEAGDKVSSYIFAGYGEKEFGAANFYSLHNSKEWIDTFFLNWNTSIEINRFKISPKLYHRRRHDKYMLDIKNPDYYMNYHKTVIKGIQTEAEMDIKAFGSIQAVVDINRQSINSTRLGRDSRSRNSYSLALRNYKNIFFGYDASIRVDDYSDYNTDILPQAGIFFRPVQYLKLRSLIAKSARAPNYTELFYDSPSNKGNKDLSPEKAINYEAGADLTFNDNEDIKIRCTIFRRVSDNLIDWIQRPSNTDFYQATNITQVKTEGLETGLDVKICKWLNIKGSYSYIGSDIDEDQDYISKYALNHPDHKIFSQVDILLPFGRQSVRLLYKNREGYGSYLILGSTFNYKLNKYSSLFLIIDNWFGSTYWDVRGNILPGRQLMAGTRLRF